MKRLVLYLFVFICAVSCAKFDDSEIWDKLDDHEERIQTLEMLCSQMNTNISSLQTIVAAMQDGADGQPGTPGQDGADGKPGAPGTPGAPGQGRVHTEIYLIIPTRV